MKIFQIPYNWLEKFTAPAWIKAILKELNDQIFLIIHQIGKEIVMSIEGKIIEVAVMDVPNEKKFSLVYDYILSLGVLVSESTIRLLIEVLVSRLKKKKAI